MYTYIHTASKSTLILPFFPAIQGISSCQSNFVKITDLVKPATLKVRDKENSYEYSICTHFIMFQQKFFVIFNGG